MIGLLLKLDVHPNGFICYAVHLIRVADIETDRFVIVYPIFNATFLPLDPSGLCHLL